MLQGIVFPVQFVTRLLILPNGTVFFPKISPPISFRSEKEQRTPRDVLALLHPRFVLFPTHFNGPGDGCDPLLEASHDVHEYISSLCALCAKEVYGMRRGQSS